MTMPYERYSALDRTREWLLLNISNKKIPRGIRNEMHSLLRHYPMRFELEAIAADSPQYLERTPDPLVRMLNEYPEEVDGDDF